MSVFVQIPGVTGGATEQNHTGWIQVDSLQFGVGRCAVHRLGHVDFADVRLSGFARGRMAERVVQRASDPKLQRVDLDPTRMVRSVAPPVTPGICTNTDIVYSP